MSPIEPSDTTFMVSGGPCCAHMHIVYEKVPHEGGTVSDSWRCRDCRSYFWPAPPSPPPPPPAAAEPRFEENDLVNLGNALEGRPAAAEQPVRGDGDVSWQPMRAVTEALEGLSREEALRVIWACAILYDIDLLELVRLREIGR